MHDTPPKTSIVGWLPGLLLPIGILVFILIPKENAKGSLTSNGGPLGDLIFEASQCHSGQRQQFFGVSLTGKSSKEGRIKIVQNPKSNAWTVLMEQGHCVSSSQKTCPPISIPLKNCTKKHIDIRQNGWREEHIYQLEGRIRLSCTFDDGGEINTDIKFFKCG
jgi:hypothetical protein